METPPVAANKKKPARLGAHIVFADESGFLLIPNVAKTWAPVGQTPRIEGETQERERPISDTGVTHSTAI